MAFEQRALVERVRSPRDRRAFLIHLTPGGRDAQRRAAAALDGAAETLLAPLDQAERRRLVDLLARIAAHWQQLSAIQPHPGKPTAPNATGDKAPARPHARRPPTPGAAEQPLTRRRREHGN